jgi:hypothetical protein
MFMSTFFLHLFLLSNCIFNFNIVLPSLSPLPFINIIFPCIYSYFFGTLAFVIMMMLGPVHFYKTISLFCSTASRQVRLRQEKDKKYEHKRSQMRWDNPDTVLWSHSTEQIAEAKKATDLS